MEQNDLDFSTKPDVLAKSESITALRELLRTNRAARDLLRRCPLCNANIQDRRATLFTGLIGALYNVYKWCRENQVHEFTTKDIRHLLDRNCYARFGDLVRFGGLVYRPNKNKKALFGLNMTRAREFFAGVYKIPVQIVLNQVTNEIEDSRYMSVKDFPSLKSLLTADGMFDNQKDLVHA